MPALASESIMSSSAATGAFPAVDQKLGKLLWVCAVAELAARFGHDQRFRETAGDHAKAVLDLLAKSGADARKLLPEATQKAAEVAVSLVTRCDQREELPNLLQRLPL